MDYCGRFAAASLQYGSRMGTAPPRPTGVVVGSGTAAKTFEPNRTLRLAEIANCVQACAFFQLPRHKCHADRRQNFKHFSGRCWDRCDINKQFVYYLNSTTRSPAFKETWMRGQRRSNAARRAVVRQFPRRTQTKLALESAAFARKRNSSSLLMTAHSFSLAYRQISGSVALAKPTSSTYLQSQPFEVRYRERALGS